jgi:hypothetical protein
MYQRRRVTIDNDDEDDADDDDDEGVKQQVTDTIEKFVQSRHVQTLKYLRQVIDENRQLRLHIDRLKRDQDDRPPPSPPPPPQPVVVSTEDRSTEVDEPPVERDASPVEFIDILPPEIRIRSPEVVFCSQRLT